MMTRLVILLIVDHEYVLLKNYINSGMFMSQSVKGFNCNIFDNDYSNKQA